MIKSLPRLHTYYIMEETIKAIKGITAKRGLPTHGLLYADWGVGKSVALHQILDSLPGVYALTLEDRREYSPYHLLTRILEDALSISASGRQKALEKTISAYLDRMGVIAPLLIVDEAQFAFRHPSVLNFFKYLSEHPRIGFSYLFLVNEKVPLSHPLGERIKIRRAVPPLTKETIKALTEHYQITLPEQAVKLALERKVRTIELDYLLFMASEAELKEIDAKTFKALLKKLREEGLV